ncbi:MAG: hypothetical protein ACKN81_03485, partial [Pirellulaceae bacterium]
PDTFIYPATFPHPPSVNRSEEIVTGKKCQSGMIVGGNPGAQKKQASMVCRQPAKIVGSSSPF